MNSALWIVLAACAAAAVTDLRSRRIPNSIPLALAFAGACVSALEGPHAIVTFVTIAAIAFFAGIPLFALRLLGGGDVKLIAAAAATMGPALVLPFVLATILCGGLLGIAVALAHGRLRSTAANVRTMTAPLLAGGSFAPVTSGTPMPYGLAIFGGALAAVCLHLTHTGV